MCMWGVGFKNESTKKRPNMKKSQETKESSN